MNTDRLQTILGLTEAALIGGAGVVYAAMSDPAGFNYQSPVLWAAVAAGALRGIKGYFAAGVKPEPVAAPTVQS